MFNNKKSFAEKHSNLLVAAATIIGSGIAAYFGSRKATAEVMTTAANAVVGVVQNMQAPQPQAAPAQAETATNDDIANAIADAIESKAEAEEAEAEPATPSEAKTEEVKAEENK